MYRIQTNTGTRAEKQEMVQNTQAEERDVSQEKPMESTQEDDRFNLHVSIIT